MRKEIDSVDQVTDIMMNQLDKNSQPWRRLFMVKNNKVDELKRFKFLFAALLESTKDDIKKDVKEFRFAHDENDKKMNKVLGKNI